ncbi:hypothetical protein PMI09_05288 [Rhizobium sp. CF122]|nr:hypothetical protein PMI09_05288 [Rhizobium sp. CF122]
MKRHECEDQKSQSPGFAFPLAMYLICLSGIGTYIAVGTPWSSSPLKDAAAPHARFVASAQAGCIESQFAGSHIFFVSQHTSSTSRTGRLVVAKEKESPLMSRELFRISQANLSHQEVRLP